MAGKAAAMTSQEIHDAGFSVLKSANIGSTEQARRPWVIQRNSPGGFVLDRYETYSAAVFALHTELTDPDGVLRAGQEGDE